MVARYFATRVVALFYCLSRLVYAQPAIEATIEATLCIRDKFPVSPGHTLIIPKRHVGSFFDVTGGELRQARAADARPARRRAHRRLHGLSPRSLDAGLAVLLGDPFASKLAPTTYPMRPPLILALCPQREERGRTRFAALRERYAGDSEDPRAGVRWILPQKAKYWP